MKCWLYESTSNKITEINNPIYFHCPTCDLIFIHDHYILSNDEDKNRYLLYDNTMENEGYVKQLKGFIKEAVQPYSHQLKKVFLQQYRPR